MFSFIVGCCLVVFRVGFDFLRSVIGVLFGIYGDFKFRVQDLRGQLNWERTCLCFYAQFQCRSQDFIFTLP